MAESTKALQSLKQAADHAKLAMHKDGPRSFKRGQGALVKVIHKFGNGELDKDTAKKELGWRGCDVRAVARVAERNGYLAISQSEDGFIMTLTDQGTEVVKKRLAAEDRAADALFEGMSSEEKDALISLCDKISANAKDMGIDPSLIKKRYGRRCGKGCRHHEKGRHGSPKYVFVFEEGGHGHHRCHHHRH